MVVALERACDKQVELISPTSASEILELKDLIEGTNEQNTSAFNFDDQSLALEMFVCVTNIEGQLKYSNFGLNLSIESQVSNIIKELNIKCPKITDIIKKINQENVPQNESVKTLLHGHICFVTLNNTEIPVILKLQQTMESERLLIWLFKKASIAEVVENGFEIDGNSSKQYKFTKLKFFLAVDSSGRLVNAPNDLLMKLLVKNYICKPRWLSELIEVPEDLTNTLKTHENADFYEKYSTSSLDLAIGENSKFSSIFCTRTRFKSQNEMLVTINLFNSILVNENEFVFPLQVKFQDESEEETKVSKKESFPEFPGFQVIRKISESIHSSIYEAIRIFQQESRVIIKVLHLNSTSTNVSAEIKFYEFFMNDSDACEFIEKPLRIEITPIPTIFMESVGNRMDLFDYIQKNDYLPDETIKIVFLQLAKAIDYLHNNGIIHRDIKV